jgi:hypothetical protein
MSLRGVWAEGDEAAVMESPVLSHLASLVERSPKEIKGEITGIGEEVSRIDFSATLSTKSEAHLRTPHDYGCQSSCLVSGLPRPLVGPLPW